MGLRNGRFIFITALFIATFAGWRIYGAFEDRPTFRLLVVYKQGDGFLQTLDFASQDINTVKGKLEVVSYEVGAHFDGGAFSNWIKTRASGIEGVLVSLDHGEAASIVKLLIEKKLPEF